MHLGRRRSGHGKPAVVQEAIDLYKAGSRVRWADYDARLRQGFSSYLDLAVSAHPSPLDHIRWPDLQDSDLWSNDIEFTAARNEAKNDPLHRMSRYHHRSYLAKNRRYMSFFFPHLAARASGKSPRPVSAVVQIDRKSSSSNRRPGRRVRWHGEHGEQPSPTACVDLVVDACNSPLEVWPELLSEELPTLWLEQKDYKRILAEAVQELQAAKLARGAYGSSSSSLSVSALLTDPMADDAPTPRVQFSIAPTDQSAPPARRVGVRVVLAIV